MADGFTEYKLLFKKVEDLERDIEAIQANLDHINESRCPTCRLEIDRLNLMVTGDEEMQMVGLLQRIRVVEKAVEETARLIDRRGLRYGNLWLMVVSILTLSLVLFQTLAR